MKKLFLSTLLSLTLIAGTSVSLASNTNYHLSTVSPSTTTIDISTEQNSISRWVDYPDSTWDLSTSKKYKINGFCDYDELYTNYLITGKTSYTIEITNDMTKTNMKYKVYKKVDDFFDKCLKTVNVSCQKTSTITINNLDKDDEIYVYFYAPADFHGSIK